MADGMRREELSDDSLVLAELRRGLCPLCGSGFTDETNEGHCSHESGWYRHFIWLLTRENPDG